MARRLVGWPQGARDAALALACVLVPLACSRSALELDTLAGGAGRGGTPSSGVGGSSAGGVFVSGGVTSGGTGFAQAGSVFSAGFANGGYAGTFGPGGFPNAAAGSPHAGMAGDNSAGGVTSDPILLECPPGVICATQIAISSYHGCAVLSDGTATCWGSGSYGALGRGNQLDIGDDELPSAADRVNVAPDDSTRVTQVAVGALHTCALLSDGSARCWGHNEHGELGYGHTEPGIGAVQAPSSAPALVLTDQNNVGIKQLAAGQRHTCALLADRSVTCWGQAGFGQLGYGSLDPNGDTEHPAAAGEVDVTSEPGLVVTQLAMGAFHSCALLSNGSVQCWGRNDSGQLGLGHTEHIGDDELPSAEPPVSLSSSVNIRAIQIAAGDSHTCALLSDHSVRCWGAARLLGLGDIANDVGDDEAPSDMDPIDFDAPTTLKVMQVSAGGTHSCARFSDGSVKCWGDNRDGQLGGANTAELPVLTSLVGRGRVSIDFADDLTASVVTGGPHTCALQSAGSLKCWGYNGYGELGLGHTEPVGDNELPSSVAPIELF